MINNSKPPALKTLDMLDQHQIDGMAFIQSRNKSGLFLVPGKGKTVLALTWAQELLDSVQAYKVLVVAPKLVATDVWATEHLSWEHLRDLRVSVVTGTEKKRLEALRTPAEIYAINPENIAWLARTNKHVWDFDAIIIDESDYFQNHAAKRVKSLTPKCKEVDHVLAMTGTPIGNSYMGLWSQVNMISEKDKCVLGNNITRYRSSYFTQSLYTHQYTLDEGAEDEILSRVSGLCFSVEDDSEGVFPRTVEDHWVSLNVPARAAYDEMAVDFMTMVRNEEVTAANAAVKSGKLLQIASGSVYSSLEPGEPIKNRKTLVVHEAKFERCRDIVDQAEGSVLIFYNFISEREVLQEMFPEAIEVRSSKTVVVDWNAGRIPILIAHPKSAGHGLNLQYGGHTAIFIGIPRSVRQYQQAIARLARKGQPHKVKIHRILAENTIDELTRDQISHHQMTGQDFLQKLMDTIRDQLWQSDMEGME